MKYLFTLVGLFFITQINAQCIAGDCENGFGILKQKDGSYKHAFFTGSTPNGMEFILLSNGVNLINITSPESLFFVDFGMYKKGSTYVINNNTAHYGMYFNVQARQFSKLTFDKTNAKTLTNVKLKSNGVNSGCVVGSCTDGMGVYVFKDNSYYVGEFKAGNFHGIGFQKFAKGGSYYGDFNNHKREGYGMYVFVDGKTYIGQWGNGEMDGKGVLHNKEMQFFEAGIFEKGVIKKIMTSTLKK